MSALSTTTVTIHRKLVTSLIVAIVVLSSGILVTTFVGANRAVQLLSGQIIQQTSSEMEARLMRFLAPARRGLVVARAWAESGVLPLEHPEEVNRAMMPFMVEFPQISSLLLADVDGRELMLLRTSSGWVNRQSNPESWGEYSYVREWRDGEPATGSWRQLGYDARSRPWFTGAMANAGHSYWTPPYIFFTTKQPGITVSTSYRGREGARRVIAFDLLLRDITRFTMTLSAGANRRVFVLTDDDRVIGLPAMAKFEDSDAVRSALLRSPEDIGVDLVRDAAVALGKGVDPGSSVRFRSGGQYWWGASWPFPLGEERELRMLVTVPEADLVANLRRIRWWILAITALVIGIGIWRAAAIATDLSRPIAALARDSDRISSGDLGPATPIRTGIQEVGRLAEAHEQMRAALRTLLKLERDLQIAREIQQDTFPEKIPAIAGFELAGWSTPAEATGGDTYDLIGISDIGEDEVTLDREQAERVLLLLADATGHGIGPALSVTQVRSMLRMAARTSMPLMDIVRYLNAQLCDDLTGGRFITAWLGELRAGDPRVSTFSAGQGPVLHYDAGSAQVHRILPDSPPLGLLTDLELPGDEPLRMAPGDILAIISDGVFDARRSDDEMFGVERVCQLLVRHAGEPPEQILARLRAEVSGFTGGAPALDDQTAILIRCSGPPLDSAA